MPSDLVGAVVKPLEKQQGTASGSEIPPVVQTIEPTHANLDSGKRVSPGQESLIKARYASTVLRVAQTTSQQTAARLVSGLSRDLPRSTERAEIAELHFRAIKTFSELATANGPQNGSTFGRAQSMRLQPGSMPSFVCKDCRSRRSSAIHQLSWLSCSDYDLVTESSV